MARVQQGGQCVGDLAEILRNQCRDQRLDGLAGGLFHEMRNTRNIFHCHPEFALEGDACTASADRRCIQRTAETLRVVGEKMRFDYVLRPGVTPTTNALRLLEMVGLVEK